MDLSLQKLVKIHRQRNGCVRFHHETPGLDLPFLSDCCKVAFVDHPPRENLDWCGIEVAMDPKCRSRLRQYFAFFFRIQIRSQKYLKTGPGSGVTCLFRQLQESAWSLYTSFLKSIAEFRLRRW